LDRHLVALERSGHIAQGETDPIRGILVDYQPTCGAWVDGERPARKPRRQLDGRIYNEYRQTKRVAP